MAGLPPTAAAAMGGFGEAKVFPLSQIKRGMQGVAYTVFEGVNPEPMQVEILGVLKDSLGPGQDMILARLHGTKPEFTGVVAGMSGSPVYIDGKLVGAISYRIGQFSKEPIAGITPIEQMLEVRDGEVRPASARGENQGGVRNSAAVVAWRCRQWRRPSSSAASARRPWIVSATGFARWGSRPWPASEAQIPKLRSRSLWFPVPQ